MAEVDLYQVAGLVLSVLGPLVIVILANGHYAREFEKQKKKYEVKLERYSDVAEVLSLVSLATMTVREGKNIISSFKMTRIGETTMNKTETLELVVPEDKHWVMLKTLERCLGLDIKGGYSESIERGRDLAEANGEADLLRSGETTARKFRESQRFFHELLSCVEVLYEKLHSATREMRIIGEIDLAEDVENLSSSSMFDVLDFLTSVDGELVGETEEFDDDVLELEKKLAEDLEQTL